MESYCKFKSKKGEVGEKNALHPHFFAPNYPHFFRTPASLTTSGIARAGTLSKPKQNLCLLSILRCIF